MHSAAEQADLVEALRRIVGGDGVVADRGELLAYECDGFPIAKAVPRAVVLPRSTGQVAAVLRLLNERDVIAVPRGSGTGLTGGCVGFGDGVIVCTSRMKRIVEVDLVGRWACVEAGVLNDQLTQHVQSLAGGEGLHFAPDPSSRAASTIAGNASTNAGGLHTLKYGVTTNHVLGLEYVTVEGEVVTSRGPLCDGVGLDVVGLLCGSEGTLATLTKVWVRLTAEPRAFRTILATFGSSRDASGAVVDVIAAGLVPSAMEMMDGQMVEVVEATFGLGIAPGTAAMLLIEVDGIDAALDEQMQRVVDLCRRNGAATVDATGDRAKREELWSARRKAFAAIGKVSPSYCTQDACVPRSMLPEVIEQIMAIGRRYDLQITNVFHAGDGNVHPILMFDEDDPQQVRNTMLASHDILEYCISIGGALTGEHGVGVEKLAMMRVMFNEPTMRCFEQIKRAFDPHDRVNAGKLVPSDRVAVDLTKPMAARTPGGAMV